MAPLVFLTDFGLKDGFVGTMKGVVANIAPSLPIIDLSHDIPPQNLDAARFVLWNSYRYFPDNTVFVCVVDPGVGSDREIIAAQIGNWKFIAPDNGLLDYVLAEAGQVRAHLVENSKFFGREVSQTFHGRDIFSPVGAHVGTGVSIQELGPPIELAISDSVFEEINSGRATPARIVYIDHFGNLITNLRFPIGSRGRVELKDHSVSVTSSYARVGVGQPLALSGSHGLLEIAVRNGNAAAYFQANYGDTIQWYAE